MQPVGGQAQGDYRAELLAEIQLPLVNKFYKSCRESARAGRGEQVYVVRAREGIVAAVRLQPAADGWHFLRSMCVAPQLRGQGVGRVLLQGLAEFLDTHPSYCFPFAHLHDFYAQAGFRATEPGDVPDFMAAAWQRYVRKGRKIILMTYNAGL